MLDDGTDRAGLFIAVLDELIAAPAPALLILEDIHWADAATLDLIKFLGRRIHRAPALMILSYRDDELDSTHLLRSILGHLPSRHVSRLPLQRLSIAAVAKLAEGMKRNDAELHSVTGGNPFFVTEVLANPEGGVPATVRDAVLGRAALLKPAAREVLEFASIVPRAVEASLIDRVLAPESKAVEECVESGLLLAEQSPEPVALARLVHPLVAKGWSNARIAERLSRSPRTVEHHLEAILAKLEVGSRGEAVEVARDRAILPQDT